MKLDRKISKRALMIIMILLVATLIAAANDPGHDTLYVEETGNSEITGHLNISQNFSVEGGRTYQGGGLTFYGDGTTTISSGGFISGTTTGDNIYIDGNGNVYIKYLTGGDTVYIGQKGITATDLNVSGALYVTGSTATVNGKNICLADGTNCPSPEGVSVGGGWTNTSENTSTMLNVGIGTTNPISGLTVGSETNGLNVSIVGTLGPELAPALTTGNWNLTAEWRFLTSPDKLEKYANGNGNATPSESMGIEVGKTYRVEVTSSEMPVMWSEFKLGGASGEIMYSTGTYVSYITAVTDENLYLFTSRLNAPRYNISSVSVKELIDGDLSLSGLTVKGPSMFSGRIGVGTTNPRGQLDVLNNGNSQKEVNIRFGGYGALGQTNYGTAWGTVDKGLIMGNNAYGGDGGYRIIHETSGYGYRAMTMDSAGMYFYAINGATTADALLSSSYIRMSVLNSGNVGIGDTTPGEKLEVAGNINSTGGDICISGGKCLSTTGTGSGDITAVNTNGDYLTGGSDTGDVSLLLNETKLNATISALDTNTQIPKWNIDDIYLNNITGTLTFNESLMNDTITAISGGGDDETGGWTNNSENTTTMLNVGIGTTTPENNLVLGTNTGSDQIIKMNSDISGSNLQLQTWGGYSRILASGTGNDLQINSLSDVVKIYANNALTATFSNGKVGIGTTQPNATLHVNGDIIAKDDINVTAGNDICIDGGNCLSTITEADGTGGWTNTSTTTSTSLDLNIDSGTFYVNSTSKKVGVGVIPLSPFHVESSTIPQVRVSYDDSNYGNVSVDSEGNMTIKATGHIIIDLS